MAEDTDRRHLDRKAELEKQAAIQAAVDAENARLTAGGEPGPSPIPGGGSQKGLKK